jgi:hypothetical protein
LANSHQKQEGDKCAQDKHLASKKLQHGVEWGMVRDDVERTGCNHQSIAYYDVGDRNSIPILPRSCTKVSSQVICIAHPRERDVMELKSEEERT